MKTNEAVVLIKGTQPPKGKRMGEERSRFAEDQILRGADLTADQSYHVARRRQHVLGLHRWGIVEGLAIKPHGGSTGFSVSSGFAIDGYGHELIVPQPVSIPRAALEELGSEVIDVWLVYTRIATSLKGRGRWDCGPGHHNRWREEARIRLDGADPLTEPSPKEPPGVPTMDVEAEREGRVPNDQGNAWPVYLGRISSGSVDMSRRLYARLVGATVRAASGRTTVRIGGEGRKIPGRVSVEVQDDSGKPIERLGIDRTGDATLRGDVVLHRGSDLIIAKAPPELTVAPRSPSPFDCGDRSGETSSLDRASGIGFRPLDAIPKEAAPWRIYRVASSDGAGSPEELRFEIGHPGDQGNPRLHRWTIGSSDQGIGETGGTDSVTRACRRLTVQANGTVTVHGKLCVEGQLIEGPIQADLTDDRFVDAVTSGWLYGIESGTEAAANLIVRVAAVSVPHSGLSLPYTIEIANTGSGETRGIKVYESISVNGRQFQTGQVPGLPESLGRGATAKVTQTCTPRAYGDVEFAVRAIGIGPAGNAVEAADAVTVTIEAPPIG